MRYLVYGLGNPGQEFVHTRHNYGRESLDFLAKKENCSWKKFNNHGEYFKVIYEKDEFFFLKTTTLYMNESGLLLKEFIDFYKIPIQNIIVIYDEMNFPIGVFKLRQKGSSGGHNGIKDIIKYLNTETFNRIRLGIGAVIGNKVNHVIGKFSKSEWEIAQNVMNKIYDFLLTWMKNSNFEKLMSKYN